MCNHHGLQTILHRVMVVGLALFLATSLQAGATTLDAELKAELLASGRVTPELVQRLQEVERVGARILFTIPGDEALPRQSRLEQGDVHPLIVDLVGYLQPGEMNLSHYEAVRSLGGVVDASSVQALVHNPHVLVVDLDETLTPDPVEGLRNTSAALHTCFASSTVACVQGPFGGRFELKVFQGGRQAPVAVNGVDSAVFYFFGSNNWEVLAKVLDGCAINSRYWVYAAGATNQAYTLQVRDTHTGRSISYNGAVCPIADIGFFPCS